MALIVNALRIAAVLSGAFLPQGAQRINAKCLLSTMYDPVMRAANFGFSDLRETAAVYVPSLPIRNLLENKTSFSFIFVAALKMVHKKGQVEK